MDVGRPTVMTTETVNKLEEVFAIGGTDEEACFYAGISRQTLYDYQAKHPEFIDRKEALKKRPILKARQTVVKSLDDPDHAKWYLERKQKNEFSQRTETDNTTKVDMSGSLETTKTEDIIDEVLTKLKDKKLNEQGKSIEGLGK